MHGALNLETFDTPFVAPITVDGVSAVQLLAKIEARNQDKRIIHVIWDNAAYHKGPDVRASLTRSLINGGDYPKACVAKTALVSYVDVRAFPKGFIQVVQGLHGSR